MQLEQNISLKQYNTFGIDAKAEYFLEIQSLEMIEAIAQDSKLPEIKSIIGGGSNILLTKPVKGLCMLNRIKGISHEKEDDEHVWLKVQSGEVWHELVLFTIANNWAGLENLALIPGTVGGAPLQNIGAYGVEVKETIESVTFWHWKERQFKTYSNEECRFGYRDSIFKHQLKGEVFITQVMFKLNKKPSYNVSYGAIEQELEKMNVGALSIKAIADAVIAIRSSKLPDPKQIGNAGSFFKNPTIDIEHFHELKAAYPTIHSYPVDEKTIKIPAGWLIEQCGWKGKRIGDTGVHEKQALVLVNYDNAKGTEILDLSEQIIESVSRKFEITLEREVQIW